VDSGAQGERAPTRRSAVLAQALAPLRRCTEILRAVSTGIGSPWTPGQADSWRLDAIALTGTIATARREHEELRLSTRWNARARRERAALGRAEEALGSGERIAIYTRSMARALVDGSGHARPMPALSAMLASTASATTGAYAAWMASAGTPADRRPLAETVHAADDTLTSALARVQERRGSDPAQWLTFGMTLAMSQRILAEVGRPLDPAEREPA
jgi:hypothetical protein